MLISAINALTLSPALCSVLLKPGAHATRGPMRYVLGAIDAIRDGYAAIVKRLVRVSVLSLVALGGGRGRRPARCSGSRRPASSRRRTRARSSRGAAAGRRLGQPHAGGRRAGRADHHRDARDRRRQLDHRLQFPQRPRAVEQRVHGGDAGAIRGAARARARGRSDHRAGSAAALGDLRAPRRSPSTCRRSSASAPPAGSSTSCRTSAAATSRSSPRPCAR